MNEPFTLDYTSEDIAALFRQNPLAHEQLKNIVLLRLLKEEKAKNQVQISPDNDDLDR